MVSAWSCACVTASRERGNGKLPVRLAERHQPDRRRDKICRKGMKVPVKRRLQVNMMGRTGNRDGNGIYGTPFDPGYGIRRPGSKRRLDKGIALRAGLERELRCRLKAFPRSTISSR